jgi:hypothetical protein
VEARGPTGEAAASLPLPIDDKDVKSFLPESGYPWRTTSSGRAPEWLQSTVDSSQQRFDAAVGGQVRDL